MPLKISDCISLISNKKMTKAIVIIGAAAILLIFISTLSPKESITPVVDTAKTAEELERKLEDRLEILIAEIDGVSNPTVMLTIDSTCETVYARDSRSGTQQDTDESGSSNSSDSENSVVLISSGNEKTALEESVILPKVRGVAVICSGAADPAVKERVVNTVARVLDIGTSKIYVTH